MPSLPVYHTTEIGESPNDDVIWQFAQDKERVIVTKDTDFTDRILLAEPPPWIIQLRIGNMRRAEFHAFLRRVWPQMESYLPQHKLINLYLYRVETVS